ncbi:MAG: C4-dicarboxylate ABC transporter permease [Dethiosulfovibrio peptidovorans]|nr:MAG: C4-dicarboxylate ABC transporter permease [Dethiosulfovibrio peptidovorans]
MRILIWLDDHLEEYVLSGLLVMMASIVILQVFMRYVFNNSLSWAEEASRYAFVWSALVSIGYSIKQKNILSVETLIDLLPVTLGRSLVRLNNCIVFFFFSYMFIASTPVLQKIIRSNQTSPALKIPMGWVYLSASVGFLLATLRAGQRLQVYFRQSNKEGRNEG